MSQNKEAGVSFIGWHRSQWSLRILTLRREEGLILNVSFVFFKGKHTQSWECFHNSQIRLKVHNAFCLNPVLNQQPSAPSALSEEERPHRDLLSLSGCSALSQWLQLIIQPLTKWVKWGECLVQQWTRCLRNLHQYQNTWVQVPASCECPWEAAQVAGFLPPWWETQAESPAPSFGLTHSQLL